MVAVRGNGQCMLDNTNLVQYNSGIDILPVHHSSQDIGQVDHSCALHGSSFLPGMLHAAVLTYLNLLPLAPGSLTCLGTLQCSAGEPVWHPSS